MLPILTSVSSIFMAVLLFMLGNSLLSITLPLKMEAAGVANELTGVVMAAYFAGLLAGCIYGKALIFRVGHIRAFAGLSALNVGAILGHTMIFDPVAWAVLRLSPGSVSPASSRPWKAGSTTGWTTPTAGACSASTW